MNIYGIHLPDTVIFSYTHLSSPFYHFPGQAAVPKPGIALFIQNQIHKRTALLLILIFNSQFWYALLNFQLLFDHKDAYLNTNLTLRQQIPLAVFYKARLDKIITTMRNTSSKYTLQGRSFRNPYCPCGIFSGNNVPLHNASRRVNLFKHCQAHKHD